MELLKEAISVEREAGKITTQALVEAGISPPHTKPDIETVLAVEARVSMGNVEALEGSLLMDGMVSFNVIFMTAEKEFASFESVSMFKHSIEFPGAQAGMRGTVNANVQQADFSLVDSRTVRASAVVNLDITLKSDMQLQAVRGIEGVEGLCVKRGSVNALQTKRENTTFMVREDVELPKGMPAASEILSRKAFAVADKAVAEGGKVYFEGTAHVSIAYAADGNTYQTVLTIPFEQSMQFKGAEPEQKVNVKLDVQDIYVSPLENPAVNCELVLKAEASAAETATFETVEDAYALSTGLNVQREDIVSTAPVVKGSGRAMLKDTLEAPRGMPLPENVLITLANPVVTGKHAENDRLGIEGILNMSTVYSDQEGAVRPMHTQSAFSVEIDMPGLEPDMDVNVRVFVESASANVAGESIDARCVLFIEAEGLSPVRQSVVTNVQLTEPVAPHSGITIYIAGRNEQLWDVAKRFNTTVESLKKYNPNLDEAPLSEGQKLIFYKPYAS